MSVSCDLRSVNRNNHNYFFSQIKVVAITKRVAALNLLLRNEKEIYTYQAFADEFFNSFCYTFFITRPKYILCHIQSGILATTVPKQVLRILVESLQKELKIIFKSMISGWFFPILSKWIVNKSMIQCFKWTTIEFSKWYIAQCPF